jgi:hypothetical protein
MTYPFVAAAAQYGARKGPVKAFVVHMAEGGGTVGFLSRPNARNVSVHYVIERTGRIVQMVRESEASGSINPNDLRTTDDPATFGATVRKAVMGEWDRDPNSAAITVEVEGFAADGPNPAQQAALKALIADVRSRFPTMGLLGHRDFQDYKACPGKLIPWSELGGPGPASGGADVRFATVVKGKLLPVKKGTAWKYLDGSSGGVFGSDASVSVAGKADAHNGEWVVEINTGNPYSDLAPRPTLVLVESPTALTAAPTADCADAIAAEHERTRAAAIAAVEAI